MLLVTQSGGCADAREFYDHLLNRIIVKFLPKAGADPQWDPFDLQLSRKMSYDQFSAKVGERLMVDPTHIRFSTVNSTTNKPKAPVRRNANQTLFQMLSPQFGTYNNSNQRWDALYYEVMDMSLSELETKKNLKIVWVSEGISKEVRCLMLRFCNFYYADRHTGSLRCPRRQEWHCRGYNPRSAKKDWFK